MYQTTLRQAMTLSCLGFVYVIRFLGTCPSNGLTAFTLFSRLAVLFWTFSVIEAEHILFYLPRHGTQCFTATTTARSMLTAEIRVMNGASDMPIGFWLLVGATNAVIRTKSDVEHEKFSIPAPSGPHHGHDENTLPAEYRLCLFQKGGSASTYAEKSRKVYVSFAAQGDEHAFNERSAVQELFRGNTRQSDLDHMKVVIERIERTLDGVRSEIDQIRNRELATFEATGIVANRVWFMGAVTCVAVIVGGILQLRQTQKELKLYANRCGVNASGELSQVARKSNSKARRNRRSSFENTAL